MTEPSSWGRRVRELRKKAGLTQEALAERADLHRVTIADIERGKTREPEAATVQALANAMDASVDYILTGVGSPTASEELDGATLGQVVLLLHEMKAQLDAQSERIASLEELRKSEAAEIRRLRQELRDKNRADNKLNDAKYRSDWPDRSQGASSPDDAEAKGA